MVEGLLRNRLSSFLEIFQEFAMYFKNIDLPENFELFNVDMDEALILHKIFETNLQN